MIERYGQIPEPQRFQNGYWVTYRDHLRYMKAKNDELLLLRDIRAAVGLCQKNLHPKVQQTLDAYDKSQDKP